VEEEYEEKLLQEKTLQAFFSDEKSSALKEGH
jgi:hypothetical protein